MRSVDIKKRERGLFELANRQHGLLYAKDLAAAGLDRHAVSHRLRTHRLTRLHRGVYALGHTALREEAYWLAALAALGPSTALSHVTAGRFHGWPVEAPDPSTVHVSTTRALLSRGDLVIHRTRHLYRPDVFRRDGFAVTTVPRTLVDLADVLDWDRYRAVADSLKRLDVAALARARARCPKRRGAPLVTRLIEADDAHTKSEFERRFLRYAEAHGLPRPDAVNGWVAGHRADAVYRFAAGRPLRGLVVELDGRSYHERRAQMRADRHRDTDYQVAGYLILRLVWDDLHVAEAPRTTGRLRRLLDA
jgi:predicted transcriptional regulator of viral defense system